MSYHVEQKSGLCLPYREILEFWLSQLSTVAEVGTANKSVGRPSHVIVGDCCWECLHQQSTTEIANIPGLRDVAENAHFLVRHAC